MTKPRCSSDRWGKAADRPIHRETKEEKASTGVERILVHRPSDVNRGPYPEEFVDVTPLLMAGDPPELETPTEMDYARAEARLLAVTHVLPDKARLRIRDAVMMIKGSNPVLAQEAVEFGFQEYKRLVYELAEPQFVLAFELELLAHEDRKDG